MAEKIDIPEQLKYHATRILPCPDLEGNIIECITTPAEDSTVNGVSNGLSSGGQWL